MWCDDLKIALVARDIEKFNDILSKKPDDASPSELAQAMALIKEAQKIIEKSVIELNAEFEKIKLARKFSKDML